MSDVLSQSEIDALLSAISTGEVNTEELKTKNEKNIKTYDFKRPSKFSKEQKSTIEMIHETFARLSGTSLSTRTRSLVSVNIASIDEITYEEFIRSVPTPTFLSVFYVDAFGASCALEINLPIVFTILDRLLGGYGQPLNKVRALTEIEESIMRREVARLLNALKEAWSNIVQIIPRLELIEFNPQFVQIAPPSEMTLLVTFNVVMAESEGFMNLIFPSTTLEPVMTKLTTKSWLGSKQGKESKEKTIKEIVERVKKTPIPLYVSLGEADITIKDLLMLEVGDVVKLNTKVKDSLKIYLGDKVKYLGIPGNIGTHYGVKIEKAVEDSEMLEKELIV
jgi:flagellar motor switch protein FliM